MVEFKNIFNINFLGALSMEKGRKITKYNNLHSYLILYVFD